MSYAIIRLGGRQFRVQKGDKIELERQSKAEAEVLLYSDDQVVKIGAPVLKDYEVSLKEIKEKRGKKVRIGRFKSKSRYRRVKGHRQPLSVLEVSALGKKGSSQKTNEKAEVASEPEKATKTTKTTKTTKKTTKSKKVKTPKSSETKKRGRPKKKEKK